MGTIIGGPTTADGYIWWQVNYDKNPDGWSAEDWLTKVMVLGAYISQEEFIAQLEAQIAKLQKQLAELQVKVGD